MVQSDVAVAVTSDSKTAKSTGIKEERDEENRNKVLATQARAVWHLIRCLRGRKTKGRNLRNDAIAPEAGQLDVQRKKNIAKCVTVRFYFGADSR